jgi:hypothetical protein
LLVLRFTEALNIPLEPCRPDVDSCAQALEGSVDLDSSYMSKAATIAGQQLAKAGFRLASLLNGIWPSGSPTPNYAECNLYQYKSYLLF